MTKQSKQIIVTIDLDVPEDRVHATELDLIDQQLGELLKDVLFIEEEKE